MTETLTLGGIEITLGDLTKDQQHGYSVRSINVEDSNVIEALCGTLAGGLLVMSEGVKIEGFSQPTMEINRDQNTAQLIYIK